MDVTARKAGVLSDLKEVPSWVWLGGAAAVGLLWVLHSASSGSSTAVAPVPASGSTTSTAVPSSTDYLTSTALQQLQQTDQSILSYLQSAGPFGGTTPSTPTTPTSPGSSTTPTSPQSAWSIVQLTGASVGNGIFAMQTNGQGGFSQQYQYFNGGWNPVTVTQMQPYFSPNGTSTGTNYVGPGSYYGTNLPALPGG